MFRQVLVSIICILACPCMQASCHVMASLQYPCQIKSGTDIDIAWGMPNQKSTLLANTKRISTQNWYKPCKNARNIPNLLND